LDAVLTRAKERGVGKILITGTSLKESREALDVAKKYGARLATSGACVELTVRAALYRWLSPDIYK
jgi:Tat protein secretion system quality control protein TatD with DNase activity